MLKYPDGTKLECLKGKKDAHFQKGKIYTAYKSKEFDDDYYIPECEDLTDGWVRWFIEDETLFKVIWDIDWEKRIGGRKI